MVILNFLLFPLKFCCAKISTRTVVHHWYVRAFISMPNISLHFHNFVSCAISVVCENSKTSSQLNFNLPQVEYWPAPVSCWPCPGSVPRRSCRFYSSSWAGGREPAVTARPSVTPTLVMPGHPAADQSKSSIYLRNPSLVCKISKYCGLLKGTRDNFKIHVNFMKPSFLCRLRQDEAYDKK